MQCQSISIATADFDVLKVGTAVVQSDKKNLLYWEEFEVAQDINCRFGCFWDLRCHFTWLTAPICLNSGYTWWVKLHLKLQTEPQKELVPWGIWQGLVHLKMLLLLATES